jgi:hypothetical protein
MDQAQLLRHLLDTLERQDLDYAITGSHASMAFGEARLTNDIDVLVALPPGYLHVFLAAFPDSDFYVSMDAARRAVTSGGMFNIIHPESGQKIDVIVPSDDFDRWQLSRTVRAPVFPDRDGRFVAPEDLALKKMQYYQEGGSEKHLRDIAGMAKVLGQKLDRDYVATMSQRMGLTDVWLTIEQRLNDRS